MTETEQYRELTRQDLLQIFPFFGERSLFVDRVRVLRSSDGTLGNRAIGEWTVRPEPCTDHFKPDEEVNIQLLPGHFWPELLGQTLGVLAFVKQPEMVGVVLPSYDSVAVIRYKEAVFVGDKVNLCVELTELTEPDKHGRRSIIGRGVGVYNEEPLAGVFTMKIDILPKRLAMKGLERIRRKHLAESPPASFGQFDRYFVEIFVPSQELRET